ncbi:hypothetical protein DAQ1742_00585 [Dickeya aquatica]|uniref:Malonyl CoA-acyl carrier protein transacylase n=1 Tax=Dickeya aquatica TaxID=1401087 RepID=A0A375A6R1_9GAMM|nr:hypothetical protein DAQ1742_00585 [Dickeya aquatica]
MEKRCVVSENNVIGFFPGLGSRAVYQNIGEDLLKSGNKVIEQIYSEAAMAMGYGDHPEKMLINPVTLPEGKMERQGFIGASFLTHNLALAAQLSVRAQQQGQSLHFIAYSGESFGIINSAVASGALSVGDGIKIANFFTPYILLSSESSDEPFSQSVIDYFPPALKEQTLISEPYYVIALRGRNKLLTEAVTAAPDVHPSSLRHALKIARRLPSHAGRVTLQICALRLNSSQRAKRSSLERRKTCRFSSSARRVSIRPL